ncbi:phage tail tape measure protein [Algimonas porphyrae]|uniref:Phage tail tape measure protein domain-containing protein n=1 Tax=Algimonas porphyrae TaxID=1128113 RepID=A0ABQ5UZ26_9PROT|nr:phage tail tape measure protein [Algimonas porphyrae]GLQ20516.1 hypothetical protein GCM10007854_14710 [Algimonas porphyrae]
MSSKLIKVGLLISGQLSPSVKQATDGAVTNQRRIGTAIEQVNDRLGQGREARRYGRLLNELKRKQQGLGNSSERLDRGIEEVQRRYNAARRAAGFYADEVDDVTRKTRALGDAQRRNHDAIGAGFDRTTVGRAVAMGGLAIAGTGLVSEGNREEEGLYLRTVINARDGDKDAAVRRSRTAAQAFARDSLADEAELIDIEYALNSASLEEDVARAGSRMVHKLSKITRGQSGQVGEIVATTFNNLGDQMTGSAEEKMTEIGNIYARTQFKYQIRDFGQLGASMEYASAASASARLDLVQTAAVIGQLNTAGLQGSRAGTAFSAVMRNMTKAADELGFTMRRGADGGLDLIGTLADLEASLDGLSVDERSDLLGTLFGEEGKVAIVPLLGKLEELRDGHAELADAAQSDLVNEEYARFLNSTNGMWRQGRQLIGQLVTAIGSDMMPVVSVVGRAIGGTLKGLTWAIENVPGLGLTIGVLTTFIIGAAFAMGTATTATWAWNAAMQVSTNRRMLAFYDALKGRIIGVTLAQRASTAAEVGGSLARARSGRVMAAWASTAGTGARQVGLLGRALRFAAIGVRAIGLALTANPIGIVVGLVALGAFAIYKAWRPIKAFFGGLWSEIGPPVMAFGSGITRIGQFLYRINPPLRLVMGGLRQIGAAVRWVGGLLSPMEGEFEGAANAGARFGRLLKGIFSWSPIGLVSRAWKNVAVFYGNLFGQIKSLAGEAVKAIGEKLAAPFRWVGNLWNRIRGVKSEAAGLGVAANDNDIASIGSAFAEAEGFDASGRPVEPSERLQPPAPAGPVSGPVTQNTYEGDRLEAHFHGVLDGEEAARRLEPFLDERSRRRAEAGLR